jgi:hypothetical protein
VAHLESDISETRKTALSFRSDKDIFRKKKKSVFHGALRKRFVEYKHRFIAVL